MDQEEIKAYEILKNLLDICEDAYFAQKESDVLLAINYEDIILSIQRQMDNLKNDVGDRLVKEWEEKRGLSHGRK